MNPLPIMLIAGEPSGDMLAAELVEALQLERRGRAPGSTRAWYFFGAGGPRMTAAGVDLAFDMTEHAVVGLVEVLSNFGKFKRLFRQLLELARARRPELIVCVDFSGFNRRFAAAVRRHERAHPELNWHPKIVQYVSPQVWASRPGRAEIMARDLDLLLTIFPFEKAWYARRVPGLPVEFVGHPMVDRYHGVRAPGGGAGSAALIGQEKRTDESVPAFTLLLLPGSRVGELKRHLPVMLQAWDRLGAKFPNLRARMVLPNQKLLGLAREFSFPPRLEVQVGDLPHALAEATVAIASTGTVTMECAWFGVPTVAIYKTSWSTYWIGRGIIQVKYLAMPNLLADASLFPEFIQHAATATNIVQAASELLSDPQRRSAIKARLAAMVATLGGPGASTRAARAVMKLVEG